MDSAVEGRIEECGGRSWPAKSRHKNVGIEDCAQCHPTARGSDRFVNQRAVETRFRDSFSQSINPPREFLAGDLGA